jgi:hypothetical protein
MWKTVVIATFWGAAATSAALLVEIFATLSARGVPMDFTDGLLLVITAIVALPTSLVISVLVAMRLDRLQRRGASRRSLRWDAALGGALLSFVALLVVLILEGETTLESAQALGPLLGPVLLGGAVLGTRVGVGILRRGVPGPS